ncbi:MAG: hypothetical protein P8Y49_08290 [Sulfurovaceae bacterium]
MARIKKFSNKMFLSDLHQIFSFDSHDELEKYKTSLFPIGKTTDEIQTTSIFLSSLSAVKEYREEVFTDIGFKKIKNQNIQLHAYQEIPCSEGDDRPDGLLVITSGIYNPVIEWICFLEVKIGNNLIGTEQIERYIDTGKKLNIENIITISNQLVTTPFESPAQIKKRVKYNLFHWSWVYLSVTAGRLLRNDLVEDVDHIYILTELRKYFDNHSGLKNYTGMDSDWKESTEEFLEKNNKDLIQKIINSYKQEEKDICLQLTDSTGHYILLKTNSEPREEVLRKMLTENKIITSTFFIQENPKQTFSIDIDFVKRKIICYTNYTISAGKAKAQTTKLINMFTKDISNEDDIYIGAIYPYKTKSNIQFETLANLLKQKEEGQYCIVNKDMGDTIKEFEIKMVDDLGRDFFKPQIIVNRLEGLAKVFLEKVFILL